MDSIGTDPAFMKSLASGSVSNIITLAVFGILYVFMKKCNCKHSKCHSGCISCESDNNTVRNLKNVKEEERDIEKGETL